MRSSAPCAVLLVALGACATATDPAVASRAEGAGVTQFDAEPPVGATTWSRPEWSVGDRFTLLRQDVFAGTFEVIVKDDDGYQISTGNGGVLLRDLDLGILGVRELSSEEPSRLRVPVDTRYHWPLWVGKTWQCEYLDRFAAGSEVATRCRYEIERLDTITVPTGTFEALRIVRRLQLFDGERRSPSQTHIVWYAPEQGVEVRQLLGNKLVELSAFERK